MDKYHDYIYGRPNKDLYKKISDMMNKPHPWSHEKRTLWNLIQKDIDDATLTTLDPVLKQLYKGQRVPMMSYKDRILYVNNTATDYGKKVLIKALEHFHKEEFMRINDSHTFVSVKKSRLIEILKSDESVALYRAIDEDMFRLNLSRWGNPKAWIGFSGEAIHYAKRLLEERPSSPVAKNNDGRDTCVFCGAPTRIIELLTSRANVCTKCCK